MPSLPKTATSTSTPLSSSTAPRALLVKQNLYDYREGHVQYVTTFNTGPFCEILPIAAPAGGQDPSLTQRHAHGLPYRQQDHLLRKRRLPRDVYLRSRDREYCVSCIPDGAPPTSNVEASDNGLFMTNDGRVFFSTADALVPQDTDGIRDVYEYVEGRPQLISSGTGSREVGVSRGQASGIGQGRPDRRQRQRHRRLLLHLRHARPEDHNGSALKFYDARTDGGFAEPPAPPPVRPPRSAPGRAALRPQQPRTAPAAELGTLGNLDT